MSVILLYLYLPDCITLCNPTFAEQILQTTENRLIELLPSIVLKFILPHSCLLSTVILVAGACIYDRLSRFLLHASTVTIHPFPNLRLLPTDGIHPRRGNQPSSYSVPFFHPTTFDRRAPGASSRVASGFNVIRRNFSSLNYSARGLR